MTFAAPVWFVALVLLPLLIVGAVLSARLRRKQWAEFTAARLRPYLLRKAANIPLWVPFSLLLAATLATIISLARPQGAATTRSSTQLGHNVVFVIDISRSMRAPDVQPDRLTKAKLIVHELLDALPQDRVGIVAFAGYAYDYAPLTIDHSAIREMIDQLDETWATVGGSNITEAVQLGIDTLKSTGQDQNAIILLSDGEKHSGDIIAVANEAKDFGVRIISIGIGTEDGDFVPAPGSSKARMQDSSGNFVISQLHPETLRKLAEKTGGQFAVAGAGTDIPAMVRTVVSQLDTYEGEGTKAVIRSEYFQWLLLPAILLLATSLLTSTRWRKAALSTAAVAFFTFTPRAQAALEDDARKALAKPDYPAAATLYLELAHQASSPDHRARYFLAAGHAALRSGNFDDARAAYSSALLSNDSALRSAAHQGVGNALFEQGWQALTGKPYPADTSHIPPQAIFAAAVKLKLAKMMGDEGTAEVARMENLISDWTDSVRHFRTALDAEPKSETAKQNLDLTTYYLDYLKELLKEDEKNTSQSMPEEKPQDPQGQGDDPDCDKEGGNAPKDDSKKKDSGDNDKDKDKKKKQGQPKGPVDPNKKLLNDPSPKKGETPKDRARRLLKETSDLEKGPVNPGNFEFNEPLKNW